MEVKHLEICKGDVCHGIYIKGKGVAPIGIFDDYILESIYRFIKEGDEVSLISLDEWVEEYHVGNTWLSLEEYKLLGIDYDSIT